MNMTHEDILRRRCHGLFLSRPCPDLLALSRHLLGLHCWFHRNVVFSALIRGADIAGWKDSLTKTWLYRGTLHGVAFDDLPMLLALHAADEGYYAAPVYIAIAEEVLSLMEDGVTSRAEMRRIFADFYDPETLANAFSSWGGIFVNLARQGRVAFRSMTSRDFDLIDAAPALSPQEALPVLFDRFLNAYGPATLDDAAWFFGLWRQDKRKLQALNLDAYSRFTADGAAYYCTDEPDGMADIPELTLLSGFDPCIVSYAERSAVLPAEYKRAVVLSSGICLPTVAINGRVAGLWNIKKNEPTVEFFTPQPRRLQNAALDWADRIRREMAGRM